MSDTQDNNTHKTNGFFKFIIFLVIVGCIFGLVKCVEYETSVNRITSQGNSDGNSKILSRSARNYDLEFVNSNIDLGSLGAKFIFIPTTDINNLKIAFSFLDKNKNIIHTITKNIGNVKKGRQESLSISLLDFSLSTALKINSATWTVVGGTVPYF